MTQKSKRKLIFAKEKIGMFESFNGTWAARGLSDTLWIRDAKKRVLSPQDFFSFTFHGIPKIYSARCISWHLMTHEARRETLRRAFDFIFIVNALKIKLALKSASWCVTLCSFPLIAVSSFSWNFAVFWQVLLLESFTGNNVLFFLPRQWFDQRRLNNKSIFCRSLLETANFVDFAIEDNKKPNCIFSTWSKRSIFGEWRLIWNANYVYISY